jgi:hypothetical protein
MAALAAATAPVPAPRRALVPEDGPKLLIKGKGYFLHALPPAREPPLWRRGQAVGGLFGPVKVADGLVLLHTSIATGKMKILAAGGATAMDLQRGSGPALYETRIAGVAADKERLYVLVWKDFTRTRYHLQVYRPADGALIHSLPLKGEGIPGERPKETADEGPLRPGADGVTCFGKRFRFKGAKLIESAGS